MHATRLDSSPIDTCELGDPMALFSAKVAKPEVDQLRDHQLHGELHVLRLRASVEKPNVRKMLSRGGEYTAQLWDVSHPLRDREHRGIGNSDSNWEARGSGMVRRVRACGHVVSSGSLCSSASYPPDAVCGDGGRGSRGCTRRGSRRWQWWRRSRCKERHTRRASLPHLPSTATTTTAPSWIAVGHN